jgi:hypothetical protein
MIIRSGHQSTKTVRIQMRPSDYHYQKLSGRSSHDVQQHGVTCIHRIIVRRDSCGDIVHDLPCDEVRSVNLCAEEPLVVVSVNREIRVLQITGVCLIGDPEGENSGLTGC